ncbi:MAG: conserved membrane protein of unknown function [Promethearchaeota archaeon]|nr:MAG: conserved membrane protein of unknown function [Candidatus Lokiarchaeota archaeon]
MNLDVVQFLQGLSSSILVSISVFLALTISYKYFQFHEKEMLFVGTSQVGIFSPWIPDAINFVSLLISDTVIPPFLVFLIGYTFIPTYLCFWLLAFINFCCNKKKKALTYFTIIILSITQIIFLITLCIDTNLFGYHHGPFQISFSLPMTLFLMSLITLVVSTGLFFAQKGMKSQNPNVKLKSKVLFIAFIFWALGSVIESSFYLTPATVLITKSILLSSEVEFYLGYIGIKT